MKKIFLILFLSLLLNTESFANIDKIKIELEGCGEIKSTGRDRVKDYYYLYFENKCLILLFTNAQAPIFLGSS